MASAANGVGPWPSHDVLIGGTTSTDSNLISANTSAGIDIQGANHTTIDGNINGNPGCSGGTCTAAARLHAAVRLSDTSPLGNGVGIKIEEYDDSSGAGPVIGATDNVVDCGPAPVPCPEDPWQLPATANIINGNTGAGVAIGKDTSDTKTDNNTVRMNDFTDNGGLPIDINNYGVTALDLRADEGNPARRAVGAAAKGAHGHPNWLAGLN